MITAVDSSVLLDLITADPVFCESSTQALRAGRLEGRLVVCECVVAELRPALGSDAELAAMMGDLEIDLVPHSLESAMLAGAHFARYLARGGTGGRVVPDFLVGAHAQVHADRLLARDRGYLRDYFRELEVLDPSRPSR